MERSHLKKLASDYFTHLTKVVKEDDNKIEDMVPKALAEICFAAGFNAGMLYMTQDDMKLDG